MPISLVVIFIVVFVVVLLAISVGWKFYEAKRKKQVAEILDVVSGTPAPTITNILKELPKEGGTGLQGLIGNFDMNTKLKVMIQQAGMDWTPEKLMTMCGVCGLGGAVFGFLLPTGGFLAVIGIGAAASSLPYLMVKRKRSKRMSEIEQQFPEALDFLARSMRAGHAFSISLGMLGEETPDPLGLEIRTVFNEQNLGAPLETALRNLGERVPLLDVKFFNSAINLQKQTGGNLAEILGRLSYVIRERFRLRGQVKAASAHGRLTATILTLLPVITAILLCIVAPGYLDGMVKDQDGKYMCAAAFFFQLLGNFFIRKIINIEV